MTTFAEAAAHLARFREPDFFFIETEFNQFLDGELDHHRRTDDDSDGIVEVLEGQFRNVLCDQADMAVIIPFFRGLSTVQMKFMPSAIQRLRSSLRRMSAGDLKPEMTVKLLHSSMWSAK